MRRREEGYVLVFMGPTPGEAPKCSGLLPPVGFHSYPLPVRGSSRRATDQASLAGKYLVFPKDRAQKAKT